MIFSAFLRSPFRCVAFAVVLALGLFAPAAHAQTPPAETHAKGDITGDWQGTLQAQKALRTIVRISKGEKGLAVKMYSIDQGGQPITASSASFDGATFKYVVELIGGSYTGTVSSDGNSIVGTWTQGPNPLPFTLVRATKETAWEIPAPRPPPKMMAPDASPAFDVSTIKPNDKGETSMQRLTINARNFVTVASSLDDLIGFAFNVQTKQILGAPDWSNRDRYDINATLDTEGMPSDKQLRLAVRKLLEDRFKIKFHKDVKELPAFVLTVAKSGPKLTPTEVTGPLPGLGVAPAPNGLTLIVHNGLVSELCELLQSLILDRPVVDETKIPGKFDIAVTFTPDDSQFHGHAPPFKKADDVEAAPSLFEAIQQKLGLKLESQKAPVPVIVLDHVEKPSAN